jgi:site-specific DNA recombinase
MVAASHVHIYCRVSSTGQEDGYGLDVQETECRQWCAERGFTVASCVHETWSGKDRHRPELDALIRGLGPGDVILFHRASRMSRGGVLDTFLLKDRIQAAGGIVRFVQGDVDDDENGELMLSLDAWMDAKDRDRIVRQTQAGIRARVASGKPLVSGRPPYGYAWNADKSGYVLDPEAAPAVRLIFDMALAGTSLRGIVAALAERGIPSPTGKPRWAVPPVRELLLRPTYTGTGVAYRRRYQRRPGGGYASRPGTAEEQILLPDIAPPIVTPEEQAAVRERLVHNRANATRNNTRPEATLLRAGFIRCGHCGWAMHADWNVKHGALYRCCRGMREEESCRSHSILAKLVDPAVWARVEAVLGDPRIIASAVERRRQDGSLDRELSHVETRLSAIAQRQANTARAIAAINDDAVAAPLLVELRMLADQKASAEAERDELQRRIADRAAEDAMLQDLSIWCARVGANLDALSYDEKRLALAALGVQVRIWRQGTTDEAGESLRWDMTMEPQSPNGEPIVYRAAPAASPRRS